MRGHIRKRSKGSWSIVLDIGRDPATGKRKQQWVSVKGTKKDAERKLAQLVNQLDRGEFVKPTKLTLGEFLQQWLEIYASTHVRPRTLEGYQDRARHLIDSLGDVHLAELRPDHIQTYYADKLANGRRDGRKSGLSAATLVKHHNLLSGALSHAVKWGLLVRNVALAVDPPRSTRKEPRILRNEEVPLFLESTKDHPFHALFHTALWTGMRRSELLGLAWGSVDLDLATLSVTRVLHQLRGGTFIFQEPKTAKGRRQIALSPTSCVVLREHRCKQAELGVTVDAEDLVFCRIDGSPLVPSVVTHTFSKITRRLGFSGVRFHDLRHTHASLMLQKPIVAHPKIVQERLGHANIQMTLDTYSHVVPGLQEMVANRFDDLFSQEAGDVSEKASSEIAR